jgi:hypothetical protein
LHAQCYAEAMYPWEVSRTKSPLVSLNNLGILRILPPPVKRPGPGIAAEGGDSKASRGAAGAASESRILLVSAHLPTMPVHFPPTLAEWEVQRKPEGLRPLEGLLEHVPVVRPKDLALRVPIATNVHPLDVMCPPGGVLSLDDSPAVLSEQRGHAGLPAVARGHLDGLGRDRICGRAAVAKDPATSATTRINLDVLDSIRTSALSSRCTSGHRDRCPGRSSGGHGNYACRRCNTRCLRCSICSLTRAGAGPP